MMYPYTHMTRLVNRPLKYDVRICLYYVKVAIFVLGYFFQNRTVIGSSLTTHISLVKFPCRSDQLVSDSKQTNKRGVKHNVLGGGKYAYFNISCILLTYGGVDLV